MAVSIYKRNARDIVAVSKSTKTGILGNLSNIEGYHWLLETGIPQIYDSV